MVRHQLIYVMVELVLTIVMHSNGFAQKNIEYSNLSKYRNWSFVIGPVLYKKAKIYPEYGDYTFENNLIPGYSAGFEYDFHPERKWSVSTGLSFSKEPLYSIHYVIYNEDLYPGSDGDLVYDAKAYSIVTFSVPLLINLRLQASDHSFINFLTGIKVMYFPAGDAYFGQEISDQTTMETKEIFGLNLHSQDFPLYGSYLIGTGFSYAMNKMYLKADLIYVMNFKNTIEGKYQFDNLFVSPASGGDYKLSGNYIGLLFSVSLKQHEDR
jgi:hypothetical protein